MCTPEGALTEHLLVLAKAAQCLYALLFLCVVLEVLLVLALAGQSVAVCCTKARRGNAHDRGRSYR